MAHTRRIKKIMNKNISWRKDKCKLDGIRLEPLR